MATPSPVPVRLSSETFTLDKDAIVAFASRFDPQPYHLDVDAAERSIFGGLCASGWHIAALATRLISETLLKNGYPFVEMIAVSQLTWSRPSFVNEQIAVRILLESPLAESPIPGTQAQTLQVDVCNAHDTVVATMTATAAVSVEPVPETRS